MYKYITGIIQHKNQLLIAINGVPDHTHILMAIKPSCRLSDLLREIKKSSNSFINDSGFIRGKFTWQEGYGSFSYSHSAIKDVKAYVMNQKEHHKIKSFKEIISNTIIGYTTSCSYF